MKTISKEKVAKIYKITNTVNGWIYIGSTLADKEWVKTFEDEKND